MLEQNILITGLFLFAARICDVSIGTIRTIMTVQGKKEGPAVTIFVGEGKYHV